MGVVGPTGPTGPKGADGVQKVEHWVLISTGADLGLKATPTEGGAWIYHPSGIKVRITAPVNLAYEGTSCSGAGYVLAPTFPDLKASHGFVTPKGSIIHVTGTPKTATLLSFQVWNPSTGSICTDYQMPNTTALTQAFMDTGLQFPPRTEAEIDVELR